MTTNILSSSQATALLDILSHHETYKELQDLRFPQALSHAGAPWKLHDGVGPSGINQLPLLQSLFKRGITTLPGLRDVSNDFWQARCQVLIDELARADLSESYEVGYIGIRKTLATAAAAMLEAPGRGLLAGFSKQELKHPDGKYDKSKPEHLLAAWEDFQQKLVYGNGIEEIFAQASNSDKLEDHSCLIQAAHEYILVIIASFMHYILIMSSEGYTLLSMMKTANNLVPYRAIRSTLKIGNVATMISGLSRIMLAKISMNTITSFIGLTNSSDAGMSLLQTIISTMINWDSNELKAKASEIARKPEGFSRSQQELLDKYMSSSLQERQKCRMMSEVKSEPIAVTIMDEYGGHELSTAQVELAQEYLSLEMSIRDRRKICNVLCSRQPDLLTQAIREGITAYEPIIRALHNAVDLSGTVGDVDHFLQDLFKLCLTTTNSKQPVTVEDFVHLLRNHQSSVHSFIHQVCKNGHQLHEWYKEYAQNLVAEFRTTSPEGRTMNEGAGILTEQLESSVTNLPENQRIQVLSECTAHATYLQSLQTDSVRRLETAMAARKDSFYPKQPRRTASFQIKLSGSKNNSRSNSPDRITVVEPGPGVFLKRWQDYINETTITPAALEKPVRHGGDESVVNAGRPNIEAVAGKVRVNVKKATSAPKCEKTIELLAGTFKEMLRHVKQG